MNQLDNWLELSQSYWEKKNVKQLTKEWFIKELSKSPYRAWVCDGNNIHPKFEGVLKERDGKLLFRNSYLKRVKGQIDRVKENTFGLM